MQFTTTIHASVPRSKCEECGVLTIPVPWADKHSRSTLLFKFMAMEVIQACSTLSSAAVLLGLNWKAFHAIMERTVERGLKLRQLDEVKQVAIDEMSFGKGQDYVSVMADIDNNRVMEVERDRTWEAVDKLWKTLDEPIRNCIAAVAMDMMDITQHLMESPRVACPNAEAVHDKFQVSKYLGEAVDKIRRQANKKLIEEDLQTGRAWSIKENFRHFWECKTIKDADFYFRSWY